MIRHFWNNSYLLKTEIEVKISVRTKISKAVDMYDNMTQSSGVSWSVCKLKV